MALLTGYTKDIKKSYKYQYTESVDELLSDEVVYIGKYDLLNDVEVNTIGSAYKTNIGKLLLSPTRTFAPVIKQILEEYFDDVYGLIHCSGGGQTKCMKYMPGNVRVVKDNLFTPPEIFRIIQECSGADDKEMYQVFNMGCRMEIYTNEKAAERIISIAEKFNVEAQVIGRVEEGGKKELIIKLPKTKITYL